MAAKKRNPANPRTIGAGKSPKLELCAVGLATVDPASLDHPERPIESIAMVFAFIVWVALVYDDMRPLMKKPVQHRASALIVVQPDEGRII